MNRKFWEQRYAECATGWDIGKISTPLKEYIDQLHDKDIKILIPGAGNSYEAEYLWKKGFKNIYVVDIAEIPLANLKRRIPEISDSRLIQKNFFDLVGNFDLILEQTFFCAIYPEHRTQYAKKAAALLQQDRKLAGLLFKTEFDKTGPPFGGNKEEYLTYFSPYFHIEILEEAYNSIEPRQGEELFFKFRKK